MMNLVLELNPYAQFGREVHFLSTKKNFASVSLSTEKYIKTFQIFRAQKDYAFTDTEDGIISDDVFIGLFDKMDCWRTPRELGYGLMEYINYSSHETKILSSYMAIFKFDSFNSDIEYKESLRKLFSKLYTQGAVDSKWSTQTEGELSNAYILNRFGQHSFEIIGMHPRSNQKAQRFEYPAIVFHLQR